MINKLLILLGIFSMMLLTGLFSCDKCGPFPNKFKIIGLNWVNYKAVYSDTSPERLSLSHIENDSVAYEQYSIFMAPRQETYFGQNSDRRSFSLLQTAYACSPVMPETSERIDSIVIVSTKDFDANHPSGSDLADIFDVVVFDYTNGIYNEKYSLTDYLNTKPHVPNELTLILKAQPDSTTDFEFIVKYYQNGVENNDYFEFTTNRIVIKKHE